MLFAGVFLGVLAVFGPAEVASPGPTPSATAEQDWVSIARTEIGRRVRPSAPADWLATVQKGEMEVVVTFTAPAPAPGTRRVGHGHTWVVIDRSSGRVISITGDQ